MKRYAIGLIAVLVAFVTGTLAGDVAPQAPKYTIPQIMMKAHKPPANLLRTVAQGQATAQQKTELLDLYKELAKNTPPRGEAADWAERTELLVAAAQAAVDGDPDASAQLTKASNCMACHDLHK